MNIRMRMKKNQHMGNTADTNEHDTTGEAKLDTLNMEHKTFKIKQETRLKHLDQTTWKQT